MKTVEIVIENTHERRNVNQGITLAGGGALLRGMDMLVMQQTGMPVHIAERPLDCVADGAEKRLGKR